MNTKAVKAINVLEKTGCAIISCNNRDKKDIRAVLAQHGINFTQCNWGFILIKDMKKKEEKDKYGI